MGESTNGCNVNTPIYGAASKTTETGPKRAPEDPLKMVPERLTFRGYSGVVAPAQGSGARTDLV